jgi:predicted ArsR family transcriptional regulator
VLETIEELYGRDAIDAVFRMRSEHVLEQYRAKVNGETLDSRLIQLTQLREADGYMSSFTANGDGTYVLREANCPIVHVAEGCGSACDHDQALLTDVLGARVTRKSHLVSGDDACTYEISPKNGSE